MPDVFVAPEEDTPQKEKESPHISTSSAPPSHTDNEIHMFTSFCQFPKGINFENQEDNEQVHLFLRRHLITNLRWTLLTIFFLLLSFLLPFLDRLGGFTFFTFSPQFLFVFMAFYYLIVFGYAFVNFITWFYNVGLITQIRVVDIDVSHITHKNIASVSINDVVDVTYIQHGFLHNIFDYGDIHLQTEGIKPNFEFHAVSHPAKVADIIGDLVRGGRHE